MMNPEPSPCCLNSRGGACPKNLSKNSPKGSCSPKGDGDVKTPLSRAILVMLMFTTEGFSFSTRSANDGSFSILVDSTLSLLFFVIFSSFGFSHPVKVIEKTKGIKIANNKNRFITTSHFIQNQHPLCKPHK